MVPEEGGLAPLRAKTLPPCERHRERERERKKERKKERRGKRAELMENGQKEGARKKENIMSRGGHETTAMYVCGEILMIPRHSRRLK